MAKQSFIRVKNLSGFRVEISGAGGGDPDSAWETCTGGAIVLEPAEVIPHPDGTHETTPGHKYVDTLTLRGPLTAGRKAMADWINATVQGADERRDVRITELDKKSKPIKSYTYHDCFPTRYVFPALSASGTGNLYEEVEIKPSRLDLT